MYSNNTKKVVGLHTDNNNTNINEALAGATTTPNAAAVTGTSNLVATATITATTTISNVVTAVATGTPNAIAAVTAAHIIHVPVNFYFLEEKFGLKLKVYLFNKL